MSSLAPPMSSGTTHLAFAAAVTLLLLCRTNPSLALKCVICEDAKAASCDKTESASRECPTAQHQLCALLVHHPDENRENGEGGREELRCLTYAEYKAGPAKLNVTRFTYCRAHDGCNYAMASSSSSSSSSSPSGRVITGRNLSSNNPPGESPCGQQGWPFSPCERQQESSNSSSSSAEGDGEQRSAATPTPPPNVKQQQQESSSSSSSSSSPARTLLILALTVVVSVGRVVVVVGVA